MTIKFEQEEKVISEFLQSLGPWRNYVIIGGGYALIVYRLCLVGQQEVSYPVGTRDLDSLISRRVPGASKKDISQYLKEAGFKQFFKDYETPATESYVKDINGIEIEVEFLTDNAVRKDKDKNVRIAGIVAQPLSYLNLSLQEAMNFKTYSGGEGRVVSPGAWIFHKGLTFPKRSSMLKIYKDLYGIWFVGSQLGEFSEVALAEFRVLAHKYPKWFKTLQKNLFKWLENVTPNDWRQLELQDPFGGLKKTGFEYLLNNYFLK